MINNQSDTPEKFIPKDSEEKNITYPNDDNKAVVKPEDKDNEKKNAGFNNVAKKKEESDVRRS